MEGVGKIHLWLPWRVSDPRLPCGQSPVLVLSPWSDACLKEHFAHRSLRQRQSQGSLDGPAELNTLSFIGTKCPNMCTQSEGILSWQPKKSASVPQEKLMQPTFGIHQQENDSMDSAARVRFAKVLRCLTARGSLPCSQLSLKKPKQN